MPHVIRRISIHLSALLPFIRSLELGADLGLILTSVLCPKGAVRSSVCNRQILQTSNKREPVSTHLLDRVPPPCIPVFDHRRIVLDGQYQVLLEDDRTGQWIAPTSR